MLLSMSTETKVSARSRSRAFVSFVFCFQGAVPGIVQGQDVSAFVGMVALTRRCRHRRYAEKQDRSGGDDPFD
jgi:hypothetical protein